MVKVRLTAGSGGATDIRIVLDDLHARAIVAGGGETGRSGFQTDLEVIGATQEATHNIYHSNAFFTHL